MVYSIRPEMIARIKTICHEKGISHTLLENLANGYNHTLIGFKLAENGIFPTF